MIKQVFLLSSPCQNFNTRQKKLKVIVGLHALNWGSVEKFQYIAHWTISVENPNSEDKLKGNPSAGILKITLI